MAVKIGDTVTYIHARDTQHIHPDRRSAQGVVKELDVIDGENCAMVEWEWAPGCGFWIRCGLLRVVTPEGVNNPV